MTLLHYKIALLLYSWSLFGCINCIAFIALKHLLGKGGRDDKIKKIICAESIGRQCGYGFKG